jgi:hypothetical protein
MEPDWKFWRAVTRIRLFRFDWKVFRNMDPLGG